MKRKYFGTDGIRGEVGDDVINPEFVLKLGWAVGQVLGKEGLVVVGKDTRISGYMFESALEAGLSAAGTDIRLLGPMPTPGIAYLTRTFHAQAGIVISASHNPHQDNGIKFFSSSGHKLPDEVELAIEAELDKPMRIVPSAALGKVERVEDAAGRYIEFCKHSYSEDRGLKGLKVVLDCANGATYHIAPKVFRELGADVATIGTEPDGLNINLECGSTCPDALQRAVVEQGAHVGIAYDGDGDRLILVDEHGETVDGDEILAIIVQSGLRAGGFAGGVVGTLMTNLGLELMLKDLGIPFRRAAVGDRYVMEQLNQFGWQLGGETSGHILCLDKTTTGDGIISSLQVLAAMRHSGRTLSELKSCMTKYPQHMVNVRMKAGFDPFESHRIRSEISGVEQDLGQRGRVLLRKSGTEPVVRVMVEGETLDEVKHLSTRIASVVEAEAAG